MWPDGQIVVIDSEKCRDSFEDFQFLSIFRYKVVIPTITPNISVK